MSAPLTRSKEHIGRQVRVVREDGREVVGTLRCWGSKLIVVASANGVGRDVPAGEFDRVQVFALDEPPPETPEIAATADAPAEPAQPVAKPRRSRKAAQ